MTNQIEDTKSNATHHKINKSFEEKLIFYSKFSFIVSIVFACISFFKLWVYRSDEYTTLDKSPINYLVGGDAYNYIINGTHATVYMLAALIFVIIGCTLLLTHYLNKNKINN